jgi:hypothetical protein
MKKINLYVLIKECHIIVLGKENFPVKVKENFPVKVKVKENFPVKVKENFPFRKPV